MLPSLGLLDPAIDGHGPVVLSTGQQLIWALSVSLFGEQSCLLGMGEMGTGRAHCFTVQQWSKLCVSRFRLGLTLRCMC